ncbi:hypothetical protein D3C84_1052650 [compost metagenome]
MLGEVVVVGQGVGVLVEVFGCQADAVAAVAVVAAHQHRGGAVIGAVEQRHGQIHSIEYLVPLGLELDGEADGRLVGDTTQTLEGGTAIADAVVVLRILGHLVELAVGDLGAPAHRVE